MRYVLFMAATVLVAVMLLAGCTKTAGSQSVYTESCSGTQSFSKDVNAVIQTYCTINSRCHAEGSRDGVLTTYQQIYSQRNAVYNEVKSGRMPEDGSLTSTQRNAILCWISSGAANN